ncbi:MAG: hypothetical protein JSU61_09490 [Fidelibacterota bacterium]|nr:MAG: hypothetical protein JSU61_09490 [Candidatus Neomarinimicrobiota bacterium]
MIGRFSPLLGVTAILVLIASTPAQSSLELVGFGMGLTSPNVQSQGLGGMMTIPAGQGEWLYSSTASWHRIRSTQLHASIEASRSNLGDLGSFARVVPQNFHFLVHVNRRLSYGIGIEPVSRVDMAIHDSSGTFYGLPEDTLHYAQFRSISGGLSAFNIGFSRLIRPSLSIGVAVNILFGSLSQNDTLYFLDLDRGDIFPALRAARRLEFNGQTINLSVLADIPPGSRGQLGTQLVLPISLGAKEFRTFSGLAVLDPVNHRNIGSPASLTVGYGTQITDLQRIIGEVGWSKLWRDEQRDMLFGRYLEARRSMRLGWSRVPKGDESLVIGRIFYRMGFHRIDYYLSNLKNDPLTEFGFALGLGFRSPAFGHRVDLSIQIGQRESSLADVQAERFYRLSIGVTTAELWFVRPKKRWD